MEAAGAHGNDTQIMTRVGAFMASLALAESAQAEFAAE
jgi:hypothetical protein